MVVVCDAPEMTLFVEGIMMWVTGVPSEHTHYQWLQQIEGLPLPSDHQRSRVCLSQDKRRLEQARGALSDTSSCYA